MNSDCFAQGFDPQAQPMPAGEPRQQTSPQTSAQTPAATPLPLDALRLPLRGCHLIEASAGTGKTFTIAQLYVRLVLGHGGTGPDGHGFARALTPPDILVVTFTEAATHELRERIRQRLGQAAAVFETPENLEHPASEDELLRLKRDYPPQQWPACARLLRVAADWMDEAAVSTIHSWCYRMLREHAFDSGNLFTQTLLTNEADLLLQTAQDYWRQHFYGLNAAAAGLLGELVASPEALAKAVERLLVWGEASWQFGAQPLDPSASPVPQIKRMAGQKQAATQLENTARAAWASDVDKLERTFIDWLPDLDGRRWKAQTLPARLAAMRAWSQGGDTPEHADYFALSKIRMKGGKVPAQLPALLAIDAWQSSADLAGEKKALRAQLLAHAALHIRAAMTREKTRRAELGFDDVLQRLHDALAAGHGGVLAARIRQQFPVALIDEFQDTDPLQWGIFSKVYQVVDDEKQSVNADTAEIPAHALLLIGDPKQAIYGFRGADIHTYLQARRATRHHHSLGTNYRSTKPLVAAVNAVFGQAEAKLPDAAFRFGSGAGNPMPFVRVSARGRSEQLLLAGQHACAMNWWWLAPPEGESAVSMNSYREQMAQSLASQLQAWLAAVPQGNTGFLQPNGRIEPLRPRDMAVLVRTGNEADLIRRELAARGIASVYLSERDSVFASREAQDLFIWLQAIHKDAPARALRTALGSASMGRSHAWLERLNHDEALWDDMVQRFRGYRHIWLTQGVLPMVRQLLHDFALPSAWLSAPAAFNGARVLTNMLHLAEWLQTQAPLQGSPHALMRELARQIEHPGTDGDSARLRLESDDDLIKIITIHKSKGLEYPLVFLPFIGSWRRISGGDNLVLPAPNGAGRRINLNGNDPQDHSQAELERQREDLRLLYVALTRARHAVWLGVAPLAGPRGTSCRVEQSALGYLLGGSARYRFELNQLCAANPGCMRLLPCPQATDQILPNRAAVRPAAPIIRAAPPRHWQPWWVASYSALTSDLLAQADSLPLPHLQAAPSPLSPSAPAAGGQSVNTSLFDSVSGDHRYINIGSSNILPDEKPQWPASEPENPATEQAFELALASQIDAQWALAQQEAREAALDSMDWDGLTRDAARLAAPAQGVHAFARGPELGSFLHELFQGAATQGFARLAQSPAKLGELVARRARMRGWGEQSAAITQWLQDWLHAPLPLPVASGAGAGAGDQASGRVQTPRPSMRLVDMHPGHMQAELEFWLPIHQASATHIDALVRAHIEPGWPRPALSALQLRGMLKGYMDLVFEASCDMGMADLDRLQNREAGHTEQENAESGRFFVLDYKSNWLGHDDASYHPDALRAATLAHRYDLQAALYLLALHRLLRTRIAGYDPARHLGGGLVWFLRGSARADGSVWSCTAPLALLDGLDALFEPPENQTSQGQA